MAELGAVVGAVLAEFVRARAIADKLTAGIVAEYEADPVLSSMNVPRVVIGEATVTVRYVVDDIETPTKPTPDPTKVKTDVGGRIKTKLASELGRDIGNDDEARDALRKIAGNVTAPTVPQIRKAIAGDSSDSVRSVSDRVVAAFSELPPGIRRKLGTKRQFTSVVERAVADELDAAIVDANRAADLKAVLASKVNVSVGRAEMPDDPSKIQEVTVTVRPEDLDVIGLERD
jgi:hypothetical protein